MFRDNWNGVYTAGSGKSGNPMMLIGYPGEIPVIDHTLIPGAIVNTQAQSWLIVDNFKTQNFSQMQGGDNNYVQNPHPFHDNIFKHQESTGNYQGFGPTAGYTNLTIEDSVFHDNNVSGGQAGIYVSGTCVASTGLVIQRNISYNNGYSGMHLNTATSNSLISQNIVYGNGLEGIAFESGTNSATATSNLVFDNNGAEFEIFSYQDTLGPAFGADCGEYNVTNATWSSSGGGTATVTVGTMTSPGYQVGQNAYITGITPSGYNCTGTGSPNSGVGCVVTAVTGTTISYAIASNPGSYVSGGTVTSGMGDQANNLIENNTFWHNQFDRNGNAVGTLGAIFTASHSQFNAGQVLGDLGHNTFRNNIAVNYGDLGSNYRNAPILFNSSWDSAWLSTDVFDHNITWQTNGISGPPTSAYALNIGCTPSCGGYAVYDATGAALNLGAALSVAAPGYTITNGHDGDPRFVHALPGDYANPLLYKFGLLAGSPALHSGTAVGIPAYDLFGNPFATSPSMGAIEQTNAVSTPTPPTVSITAPVTNSTASGKVAVSASATAFGTFTVASVQFEVDGTNLGSAVTLGPTYTITWDTTNYTNGSHTLTAIATDSGGNTATSSIFITVNNVVAPPPSSGAGWQDLANTQLKSVCPADGFGGINYQFADLCPAVVSTWSGGAADTKRNRLIIWGGGHTDYSGNEVYSLNLGTASPTLTRLTNPSDFTKNTGCPDTNVVDGTPVSRHTYGGLVYLPVQDKMFSFGGALAPCGGPISTHTYTLDLSKATPTWQAMDPVNGFNPLNGYWPNSAVCAYDPNTLTVICSSAGYLLRYDPATNTYTKLNNDVQPIPYSSFGAIDPKRKLFIFMGTAYQSTTPYVVAVDISSGSNFTAQDWSSQVTGCNALASAYYPGLTYDSVLDRIVGWPNSGNTVYLFDPDTKTCTAQTFPNGPTNAPSTTGTFGRFQYFPGLNAYAVVSLATLDAFQLTLSTASPAGPPTSNPCDLNADGAVNSLDVQIAINQALGMAACGNAALQQAGQCNVVDVQRVINASLGGACRTGQ